MLHRPGFAEAVLLVEGAAIEAPGLLHFARGDLGSKQQLHRFGPWRQKNISKSADSKTTGTMINHILWKNQSKQPLQIQRRVSNYVRRSSDNNTDQKTNIKNMIEQERDSMEKSEGWAQEEKTNRITNKSEPYKAKIRKHPPNMRKKHRHATYEWGGPPRHMSRRNALIAPAEPSTWPKTQPQVGQGEWEPRALTENGVDLFNAKKTSLT